MLYVHKSCSLPSFANGYWIIFWSNGYNTVKNQQLLLQQTPTLNLLERNVATSEFSTDKVWRGRKEKWTMSKTVMKRFNSPMSLVSLPVYWFLFLILVHYNHNLIRSFVALSLVAWRTVLSCSKSLVKQALNERQRPPQSLSMAFLIFILKRKRPPSTLVKVVHTNLMYQSCKCISCLLFD